MLKLALWTIICEQEFEEKVVKHESMTTVLISDEKINCFENFWQSEHYNARLLVYSSLFSLPPFPDSLVIIY